MNHDIIVELFSPLQFNMNLPGGPLEASFGETLEFLIQSGGSGRLYHTLANIPTYRVSNKLWKQWFEERSEYLHASNYQLVALGLVKLGFDMKTRISIGFSIISGTAFISVERKWHDLESVANVFFGSVEHRVEGEFPSYEVTARIDDKLSTAL
jgi:hypothetical protein